LEEIASNGRNAALGYDAFQRMVEFFGTLGKGT